MCLAEQFSPNQFSCCHVHGTCMMPPEPKGETRWEPQDKWERFLGPTNVSISYALPCITTSYMRQRDFFIDVAFCHLIQAIVETLFRQSEVSLCFSASLCYREVFLSFAALRCVPCMNGSLCVTKVNSSASMP